ncbi:hypothetical protein DPMN_154417 [Dreissena polymorpha]|uniref:Uncharacterized protein n=1 Tax=Dreissena polymorpha TaxID=45954 RepID=A0A9D4FQR4_DREPO|nr:hypothetical protein DPMN_154417 [Dreissena polymorpha]
MKKRIDFEVLLKALSLAFRWAFYGNGLKAGIKLERIYLRSHYDAGGAPVRDQASTGMNRGPTGTNRCSTGMNRGQPGTNGALPGKTGNDRRGTGNNRDCTGNNRDDTLAPTGLKHTSRATATPRWSPSECRQSHFIATVHKETGALTVPFRLFPVQSRSFPVPSRSLSVLPGYFWFIPECRPALPTDNFSPPVQGPHPGNLASHGKSALHCCLLASLIASQLKLSYQLNVPYRNVCLVRQ